MSTRSGGAARAFDDAPGARPGCAWPRAVGHRTLDSASPRDGSCRSRPRNPMPARGRPLIVLGGASGRSPASSGHRRSGSDSSDRRRHRSGTVSVAPCGPRWPAHPASRPGRSGRPRGSDEIRCRRAPCDRPSGAELLVGCTTMLADLADRSASTLSRSTAAASVDRLTGGCDATRGAAAVGRRRDRR